jgi:hypothetical protein
MAVGIAPELGALRIAHESSSRRIDAVSELDESTSMMAHKFLSGLQDPPTRLDNRGNWATARILALGSPWHTCIERTSSRMASPSARWRIAGRSPELGLLDHNRCRGHSADYHDRTWHYPQIPITADFLFIRRVLAFAAFLYSPTEIALRVTGCWRPQEPLGRAVEFQHGGGNLVFIRPPG